MNNKVTPKAGQVWEENQTGNNYVIDINPAGWISGKGKTFGFGGYSKPAFLREFTFTPQSDLEFWAVEIDVWPNDLWKSLWFRRDERGAITRDAQIIRTEWQNTRYELGLDEKPKVTKQDIQDFMSGAIKIL